METEYFVIRINELTKEHVDNVGKKCANLGELSKAGFRVPPGFALSLKAYDEFMNKTDALKEIKDQTERFNADPSSPEDIVKFKGLSKSLREIVESKNIPAEIDSQIVSYYKELCRKIGAEDTRVAVRSAGPVSHPGQYETYLHVRGLQNVKQHILKVWSSSFNTRSLIARARRGLPLAYDPIGVAVIEMVNARAAGIMFTADPNTADKSKIFIEGNWGLGESVVGGNVTPDSWVVDKYISKIVDSKASVKEYECRLDLDTGKVIICNIPADRKQTFCLTEEQVLAIADLGTKAEKHFKGAQDMEWAVSEDPPYDVYLLQTRPEKFNISINISGF
jgi:pyruvate,water dikinase